MLRLFATWVLALEFARSSFTPLESSDLHSGIKIRGFDLVVDVRSQAEWEGGHIPSATLVADLAAHGNATALRGCERCRIAVYCRTGARARAAALRLSELGFTSLYHGLGVAQWEAAGYRLTTNESVPPNCGLSSSRCMVPANTLSCRTLRQVHSHKGCCS